MLNTCMIGTMREQDMYKELGKYNDIHPSAQIGDGTRLSGWTFIGKNVKIGKNCKIGNHCEINSGVQIGDGTLLTSYTFLSSDTIVGDGCMFGSHSVAADEKIMTPYTERITRKPCIVGNNCRIGTHTILVSCTLGDWVSTGAGTVVLEPKIKSKEVWAGVPARKIRDIKPFEMEL